MTSRLGAALLVALAAWGCAGGGEAAGEDSGTDSETDTDSHSETGTDTDSSTDSVTETETDTETGPPWEQVGFTLLTYNVGNPDAADPLYPLRMSSQDYEDHMAGVIQALSPDVVVLQEVLSAKTCEAFTETDPSRTCYQWDTRPRPARRLLGPDYTIVCDDREQVECIGVNVSFGAIEGLVPGGYDDTGAETPPLPLDPCVWADDECTDDLCDAESTVSAVTIDTGAGPLRLAHVHPMAQVSAFISGDWCRTLQLRQVFEGAVLGSEDAMLEGYDRSVIAGDWNLGLEVYWARTVFSGADAALVWEDHVGCDGCYYSDVDPRDDGSTRYSTTSAAPAYLDDLGLPIAIDHVVLSEGVTGECAVHDSGGQPGTDPLDEAYPGLGELGEDERIDHYGILCDLVMTPSGT